jgi:hypothetical protein
MHITYGHAPPSNNYPATTTTTSTTTTYAQGVSWTGKEATTLALLADGIGLYETLLTNRPTHNPY